MCSLLCASALGQPSSLDIYVTYASDYLNRGLSQTDGDDALQLGLDYRHRSGLFAGAWTSNIDYRTEQTRLKPRDREFDFYVGFNRQLEKWSWTGALALYQYPGTSFDYHYRELSLGVRFRERFSYQASYTNDLLDLGFTALNQEFGANWPLAWNTELGAVVGHFSSADIPGRDYVHFNLGVSKLVEKLTVDLRYYDTNYDVTTHLGAPADSRWVLSVSYGFSPL